MPKRVVAIALAAALCLGACARNQERLGTGDFGAACPVWSELLSFPLPDTDDRAELRRWAAGIDRVLGRIDLRKTLGSDKTRPSAALRRNLGQADQAIAAYRRALGRVHTTDELRLADRAFSRRVVGVSPSTP